MSPCPVSNADCVAVSALLPMSPVINSTAVCHADSVDCGRVSLLTDALAVIAIAFLTLLDELSWILIASGITANLAL